MVFNIQMDTSIGSCYAAAKLAGYYRYQGRYVASEKLYPRLVKITRRVLGEEHTDKLVRICDLARVLTTQTKYREAEQLVRKSLNGLIKIHGKKEFRTLNCMTCLAVVLRQKESYEEAEPMIRETLRLRMELLGNEHPDTMMSRQELAEILLKKGSAEAESMYRECLRMTIKMFGEKHPRTIRNMNNLASTLSCPEAAKLFRQTLRLHEEVWKGASRDASGHAQGELHVKSGYNIIGCRGRTIVSRDTEIV